MVQSRYMAETHITTCVKSKYHLLHYQFISLQSYACKAGWVELLQIPQGRFVHVIKFAKGIVRKIVKEK